MIDLRLFLLIFSFQIFLQTPTYIPDLYTFLLYLDSANQKCGAGRCAGTEPTTDDEAEVRRRRHRQRDARPLRHRRQPGETRHHVGVVHDFQSNNKGKQLQRVCFSIMLFLHEIYEIQEISPSAAVFTIH